MRFLLVFISLLMLSNTAQAGTPDITINATADNAIEFFPPDGRLLSLQCPELQNVENVTKLRVIKDVPRVYIVTTTDGQVLTPTTCQVRVK